MQCARYYCGFDFDRLGTFTLTIANDASSKTYAATFTTGKYWHDFNDGTYLRFEDALQTALNTAAAAAGSAVTWTVTWKNDGLYYEITPSSGTFDITANALAAKVTGLSTTPATTISVARSVDRPWFVISVYNGGTSLDSGDRHMPSQVRGGMTAGGTQFAVGPVSGAFGKRTQWTQRMQPAALVYRHKRATTGGGYAGTGRIDFVYEEMWEHCGAWEPIALCISEAASISWTSTYVGLGCVLVAEDSWAFAPIPSFPNGAEMFLDIPFDVIVTKRFNP